MIDTASNTIIGTFTTDDTSAGPREVYIGAYSIVDTIPYPTRYVAVAPEGTVYVTDYTDGKAYAVTVGDPTVV